MDKNGVCLEATRTKYLSFRICDLKNVLILTMSRIGLGKKKGKATTPKITGCDPFQKAQETTSVMRGKEQ